MAAAAVTTAHVYGGDAAVAGTVRDAIVAAIT